MLIRVSIVSVCRNVAMSANAVNTAITMKVNDFPSRRQRSETMGADAPTCSGDSSTVPESSPEALGLVTGR